MTLLTEIILDKSAEIFDQDPCMVFDQDLSIIKEEGNNDPLNPSVKKTGGETF